MTNSRAAIGQERRRYIKVREAFATGLERGNEADSNLTDFFLTCAAYVIFSMDRLHFQDQMIHDLLAERIPVDDIEAHERLRDLAERQNNSRALVENLQCATNVLQIDGPAAYPYFTEAARQFNAAIVALMKVRRNPFEAYTDKLFTDDDWSEIANISEDTEVIEANLYSAVRRTAPEGLDPEGMEVVYH